MSGVDDLENAPLEQQTAGETKVGERTWPLMVRFLAVCYVLSWLAQPLGFFALAVIGSFRWIHRREVDAWVIGFWLGGIGWLVGCAVFRWSFREWGRRRWQND